MHSKFEGQRGKRLVPVTKWSHQKSAWKQAGPRKAIGTWWKKNRKRIKKLQPRSANQKHQGWWVQFNCAQGATVWWPRPGTIVPKWWKKLGLCAAPSVMEQPSVFVIQTGKTVYAKKAPTMANVSCHLLEVKMPMFGRPGTTNHLGYATWLWCPWISFWYGTTYQHIQHIRQWHQSKCIFSWNQGHWLELKHARSTMRKSSEVINVTYVNGPSQSTGDDIE